MPAESNTDPEASATRWRAVLVAAFCGIAVAINVGKVPIVMPALRDEFGLSMVTAAWIASMINMLALASALFFGFASDRIGPLRMCCLGLGASILGGLAALMAGSGLALLFSRFAEGAGMVAVAVSAPSLMVAASHPRDRRFVLSIWSAYLPAGVGLIMLIAPLLQRAGAWRPLWLLALAALVAAAAAVYRMRPAYRYPEPAASDKDAWRAAREVLTQAAPWLLACAMGSWTVQHFTLIIWLPTLLSAQPGLTPPEIALMSCLMVLVSVPGNLLGGYLLEHGHGRGKLIAIASLLSGLAGVGIFLDGLPGMARYGLCLFLSFIGGPIPACVFSASASLARNGKQVATLQGLFMQGSNLGCFLGPLLTAMLVSASGRWSEALIVTGSAAGVGILMGILVGRLETAKAK